MKPRSINHALDGNAQIAIICTISPASRCVDESLNTLKFAARAKLIKMNARVNEVLDDKTLIKAYKEEIDQLRSRLHELKLVNRSSNKSVIEYEPGTSDDSMLNNNEEVMLQMISEMEKLILKADLSKGSNHINISHSNSQTNSSPGKEVGVTSVSDLLVLKKRSFVMNKVSTIETKLIDSLHHDLTNQEIDNSFSSGNDGLVTVVEDEEDDSVLFGVTKILSMLKKSLSIGSSKKKRTLPPNGVDNLLARNDISSPEGIKLSYIY